jgi:glycosyltransferase involved in cell wall biosynthesis
VKVLQVSPVAFAPDGIIGGAERYALELARAMASLTETRLVTFGRPRVEQAGPLSVRAYRPWAYVGRKRLGPLAPALIWEMARADVVHCHQAHTFLADLCVLLGRLLRKPVFLTDHAGGDRHFNRRLGTIEHATGLLLVSEHNAAGFAPHRGKIRVIYGGADTERFAPRPLPRQRSALYVGRLIPYKGVHHLIEGVRADTEVRLAGAPYHAEYERFLRQVAKGRNVRFLGPVLGDALVDEYCSAGVCVLPSVEVDRYGKRYPKGEILGLVLLEAMACQTPVVCSNIGGMPELVADGETGLIVPAGDSARLGEAVEQVLDDPALARRLGQAGRERVLARFTWRAVAERCLAAYGELGRLDVDPAGHRAPRRGRRGASLVLASPRLGRDGTQGGAGR